MWDRIEDLIRTIQCINANTDSSNRAPCVDNPGKVHVLYYSFPLVSFPLA